MEALVKKIKQEILQPVLVLQDLLDLIVRLWWIIHFVISCLAEMGEHAILTSSGMAMFALVHKVTFSLLPKFFNSIKINS